MEKGDLVFSPDPKLRMRKTHRASTVLLNNVKNNIDKIPIKSRRKISSMPLEILQLKKSKSSSSKTFLVPLGFSSYDAFVVQREETQENEQKSLELHLRTNKSKFYVIIDDLHKFKHWMQSEIANNLQQKESLYIEDLIQSEFGDEHNDDAEELNYNYSFRMRPCWILSILMNIVCFFILCSIDYIEVEVSFFEPLRETINRFSREFEIIHNRIHQHKYQYHEISSLYDELNTITIYCDSYIQSIRPNHDIEEETESTEQTETVKQNEKLFEFCETFLDAHQQCPVDILSIHQI